MFRALHLSQMVASTPVANGSYLPAFVRSLLGAKTGIQLVEVATQIIREIGFETLIYGSVFPNQATDPTIVVATTISGKWMERYDRMHYFNVDPRFQICLHYVTPFLWDSRKAFAPQASAFLEDAARHGMRSGITLPLRSPMGENAMFGVESPLSELPDDQRLQLAVGRMYLFASHFHDRFFHNLRKQAIGTDVRPPHASRRELEVLTLAARGHSSKRIGRELGISESTANFHIASVKHKFGVRTRSQAIAQAVHAGLIR
jgi:DNA-binding CsgD family transcriptional regulator